MGLLEKIFNINAIIFTIVGTIAVILWIIIQLYRKEYLMVKRILEKGLRSSKYLLVRGKDSPYYYDIDDELSRKIYTDKVSEWYVLTIKRLKKELKVDRLAFIEKESGPIGAILLQALIIQKIGIPGFVIRVRRRVLLAAFKGDYSIGKEDKVLLISDVVTSGGTVIQSIKKIEELRMRVVGVVALVNRGGYEPEEKLKEMGIILKYAVGKDMMKEAIEKFKLPIDIDVEGEEVQKSTNTD